MPKYYSKLDMRAQYCPHFFGHFGSKLFFFKLFFKFFFIGFEKLI